MVPILCVRIHLGLDRNVLAKEGLLLGREFDDVRASNRCTAEIDDAAVNVSKGSIVTVGESPL